MSERLTIDQMADVIGVTRQAVGRYVSAGCPHQGIGKKGDPYTFDRDEVIAWLEQTGRDGIHGAATPGATPRTTTDTPTTQTTPTIDVAKINKLTRLVGLEIKRLEVARRKRLERIAEGELHDRVDCERGRLQRIATVRAGLLSLPSRLAARLVGREAHEIEAEIAREVHHLLAQFAGRAQPEETTG